MNNTDAAPMRYPWPPIILVVAIVLGSVVHGLYPLRLASGPAADIMQGVGIFVLLIAIAIYFLSIREMRRHDTTVHPTSGASHLVTSGPFAFTRNPIYLANVVLLLALGMIFINFWLLILAFLSGYATQKLAIEPEEAHLERKFGKAFRDFRKKVRRWI